MYRDISIQNNILDNRRALSFYLTQQGFDRKHLASLTDTSELFKLFGNGVVTSIIRLYVESSSMPMEIFAGQCMEAEQTYSALLIKKDVRHISHCNGAGILVFHLFPQKSGDLPHVLECAEKASEILFYAHPHTYISGETADVPEEAYGAYVKCLESLVRLPLAAGAGTSDFHAPDRVRQAIKIMEQNYCDSSLSIESISDAIRLTPSHFSKIFKAETGISPLSFLTEMRMDFAKKLLSEGDDQIGSVALESGYESCEYFCRVFRNKTGMTPSQFRNKARRVS